MFQFLEKNNMQSTTGDKFSEDKGFFDFSDYGRPFARIIAKLLVNTSIGSITVTWLFTVVGLYAAVLIWQGKLLWLAALLLPLKSILDAVDGQLARIKNHPSYVGRYLDSVNDFFVNLAVFLAIGHLVGESYAIVLLSLILATLQGTVVHYYEIVKRHISQGDKTSRIDESKKPKPYPWDNPISLAIVYNLYILIYDWQEKLIRFLDPKAYENLPSKFLSAMSFLGLGWQLLMICIFLLLGKPILAIYYFIIPATAYMVVIIGFRRLVLQNLKSKA